MMLLSVLSGADVGIKLLLLQAVDATGVLFAPSGSKCVALH